MPVTRDNFGGSESVGGSTTTIDVTASSNSAIILSCEVGTDSPTTMPVLTITGTAGLTWTSIGASQAGGQAVFNSRYYAQGAWIAQCPGGLSAATVTITSSVTIDNAATIYASYVGDNIPNLDPGANTPVVTNIGTINTPEETYNTTTATIIFAFIGSNYVNLDWINPVTPAGSEVVDTVTNAGGIYWAYLGLMTVPVASAQTGLLYGSTYATTSDWTFMGGALTDVLPTPPIPVAPVQPIKVSSDYIKWLLATNRGIMGHLYQFTSATGVNDYFTDLDFNVNYDGVVWKANSLRFEGMARKLQVGLDVDEQTVKIWAKPTDTLFGALFLPGAEQGLLDGAIIQRSRIVWQFQTGNAAYDTTLAPIAVWVLSTGYTSQIAKGGLSHIELKVKSALHKLEVNMPRNYYQPGCLWTLFDAGCTLVKSAFKVTGTVGSSPTSRVIPVSGGIATPVGADGIASYAQGRLLFTSGVNNNLQVLIDNNDTNNLYLAYLLDEVPSAGDTFNYYPGCSKAFNTCDLKYSNKANFRGFDKVPPVMLSL